MSDKRLSYIGVERAAPSCSEGFTLLELMIVVAVIAILAAIAVPSYQEQVRKSRRAQAKADLVELAQLAERYRTVNNAFTGFSPPFTASPRTGTAYYTLSATVTNSNAFTITAAPQSTGGQDQDRCGTLTINHAGAKTNSSGAYSDCW